MKTQIEKYKVHGKVYAWTFKDNQRNYPGWNLTVDLTASKDLTTLLDFMKVCEWTSKKTIDLELPTNLQIAIPNNQNGQAKWKTKSNLTLSCKKNESDNHWVINETKSGIEIQFGKNKLTELQTAIIGIPEGKGDFAIANEQDDDILYIWWNTNK
ncbi:hypothetical protein [Carboxylicivirga marina]|uniref:hypothetical protein n=1 Tax=Carboxylicivirga marina TaxID=2800988 RepID=UPI0025975FE4|nr:hypothetical protein [uncultured Carboxylicivirga sp.]